MSSNLQVLPDGSQVIVSRYCRTKSPSYVHVFCGASLGVEGSCKVAHFLILYLLSCMSSPVAVMACVLLALILMSLVFEALMLRPVDLACLTSLFTV